MEKDKSEEDAMMMEYFRQMEMDFQVDATNITEKLMLLGRTKVKWLHKWYEARRKLNNLTDLKEKITSKAFTENSLGLSKMAITKNLEKDENIIKLNIEIRRYELIEKTLDKLFEKILNQMSYDYSSLVKVVLRDDSVAM